MAYRMLISVPVDASIEGYSIQRQVWFIATKAARASCAVSLCRAVCSLEFTLSATIMVGWTPVRGAGSSFLPSVVLCRYHGGTRCASSLRCLIVCANSVKLPGSWERIGEAISYEAMDLDS